MPRYILALDQGTTSSRSILFDAQRHAAWLSRQRRIHASTSPDPAGSSTTPREIWNSPARDHRRGARGGQAPTRPRSRRSAITNQRETALLWRPSQRPSRCAARSSGRTADAPRALRNAARRGPGDRGVAAHRIAAGPLLLRHQARMDAARTSRQARRARRQANWPSARSTAGLVWQLPAAKGARDRRLEREPHDAARTGERRLGRRDAAMLGVRAGLALPRWSTLRRRSARRASATRASRSPDSPANQQAAALGQGSFEARHAQATPTAPAASC